MSGFFQKKYFDLLQQYDSVRCEKNNNPTHTQVYETLQEANNLTKIWAEKVIETLFDHGHLGGFRNKPTNQGQKFKPYTWAKIYPRKTAPKQLAYTVGIDAYSGYVVKIDTVGVVDDLRPKYEKLRGDYDSSTIVSTLPITTGLSLTLEELVEWSIVEIKKFGLTYDEICNELELVDGNDFTAQQALEFLKARYAQSEQVTEKLFVSINKLNKEIALETRDLETNTIRIFIKDQPPQNILPERQYKFIPSNTEGKSPNSNLNTNSLTLRAEDDFYQVGPQTQAELNNLCNWLDEITTITVDHQATLEKKDISGTKKMDKALNRILFGAAGTGKTYNTINHALAILEEENLTEIENQEKQLNGRKKLKDRFDKFKNEGRIKFVTFHQSFSYEDFVEGIRAEVDTESDQLSYRVKSGVFKEICEKATGQYLQLHSNDNSLDSFLEEISIKPLMLNTIKNKEFKVSYIGHGHVIHCQPLASESNATYRANINSIREILQGDEPEILYNSSYVYAIANYIKQKIQPTEQKVRKLDPYVLIIDEINRGNISRIFGELITLIEESKRAGADEALSVTLPYSKKEFSVPSNVYIIGTMNSSDRSLTGLDIALRRRFTFIEMPPKPELLDGISVDGLNIGTLLKVINQRIEVLLDRDHCIGHANFMSLKEKPTLEHLADIFKQKIIPQLQEYFFDDWAKINLVFFNNRMIVEDKDINFAGLFPANTEQDMHYSEQKKIWKINDAAFETIDAFISILGSKG